MSSWDEMGHLWVTWVVWMKCAVKEKLVGGVK